MRLPGIAGFFPDNGDVMTFDAEGCRVSAEIAKKRWREGEPTNWGSACVPLFYLFQADLDAIRSTPGVDDGNPGETSAARLPRDIAAIRIDW